jgi:hypothetical protein
MAQYSHLIGLAPDMIMELSARRGREENQGYRLPGSRVALGKGEFERMHVSTVFNMQSLRNC